MGYTTDFSGQFNFNRPLTTEEANYIRKFNDTRRMKRDVKRLQQLYKGKGGLPLFQVVTPEMEKHIKFIEEKGFGVTLTCKEDKRTPEEIYGVEGEYFVDGRGRGGQDRDDSIIDNNSPSTTQPGLWCQWRTDTKGQRLEWDGGEKFYNYVEWLKYLISNFFEKWGVVLNGIVTWEGEESGDVGKIIVENNEVIVKVGRIVYE